MTYGKEGELLGTTNFTYDLKNQLLQEVSTRGSGYTYNFGYDTAGNATTFRNAAFAYNVYDGHGNPTTYGGNACVYDPENHLISYGSSRTMYRPDGLRAWKQGPSGRVYYLYDGDQLLYEINSSGQLLNTYGWGVAGRMARRTSGGLTYYYTYDPSGNLVQRHRAGALSYATSRRRTMRGGCS